MAYIYLSPAYYYFHMDVTKETLLVGGVFRCPSGLFFVILFNSKVLMNMSCNLNFV